MEVGVRKIQVIERERERDSKGEESHQSSHNLLRPFKQFANAPEDTRYLLDQLPNTLSRALSAVHILGVSQRVMKGSLNYFAVARYRLIHHKKLTY